MKLPSCPYTYIYFNLVIVDEIWGIYCKLIYYFNHEMKFIKIHHCKLKNQLHLQKSAAPEATFTAQHLRHRPPSPAPNTCIASVEDLHRRIEQSPRDQS